MTLADPTGSSHARARDGRCVALARSRGRPCEAPAAVGSRCWVHGAATIAPPWTLTTTGDSLAIFRASEEADARRRPSRVQRWAAIELARRGVITGALFFAPGRGFARILRRISRAGVRVIPEGGGLVARYRFEASLAIDPES